MMRSRSMIGASGVLAAWLWIGWANGGDWPQWRGPNRDAKATDFKAPASWPKQLKAVWKESVGDGVATPSLWGDRLYVFSRQGENEIVRCLDFGTGKQVWKYEYPAEGASGPARGFAGPRCSPTVADGKVVTLGANGTLLCLDAASGNLVWRKDEFGGAVPTFYTSSSPIVIGGLCIAQLGGRNKGGIVAFALADGAEKWRWTGDSPAYASPVAMTVGGDAYVVAQTNAKMVALRSMDGSLAWEAPFEVSGRGYNAATPIVDGQTVIYCGSGRGATAVRLEKDGDRLAAKELWKNSEKSVIYNTPVLKEGRLYGLTQTNELFCIDAGTGKTEWSAPIGSAAAGGNEPPPQAKKGAGPGGRGGRGGRGGGRGGQGYGSIVDIGTALAALTPASELVIYAPDPKAFKEIARIKVAESPTYAYPVLTGDRIVVKDQNSVAVYALEASS